MCYASCPQWKRDTQLFEIQNVTLLCWELTRCHARNSITWTCNLDFLLDVYQTQISGFCLDIIFDISLKTFSSHKLLNIGQENALWLFRWSLTERFFHLLIICAVFYIIWPLLHVPQSLRVKQEILNSIFDYMFCLDTNIVHIVLHRFVPTCFSIYPYIQYSSFNILIFLPHVKLWPPIVDVVVVVDTSPVNSWTDS